MSSCLARAATAVAPLAAAVVATRYWPHARELALDLSAPHRWIDAVGADSAAATLAGALLWLAAMWLCFGTSATVLSLGPGQLGRVADLIARHALPSALRRVVIAAAGASILAAPASAFLPAGRHCRRVPRSRPPRPRGRRMPQREAHWLSSGPRTATRRAPVRSPRGKHLPRRSPCGPATRYG